MIDKSNTQITSLPSSTTEPKKPATQTSSWLGRTWTAITSQITMDGIAKLSIAASVALGGYFSGSGNNFQEQTEGIAFAGAASSLVCFAWALGCAAKGNYSKAAKRLLAAGALGSIAYRIQEADKPVLPDSTFTAPTQSLNTHKEKSDFTKGETQSYLLNTLTQLESTTEGNSIVNQIKRCTVSLNTRDKKCDEGVKIFGGYKSAFSIESLPNIIFKIVDLSDADKLEKRHSDIINAKRICEENGLNLLKVPDETVFRFEESGKQYQILVRERVNIADGDAQQEYLYEMMGSKMNPALEQLVVFIAKTGFRDVEWRNIPVLINSDESSPQIALVDLDHLGDVSDGLFGGMAKGLVRLVNEEQMDLIHRQVKALGINMNRFEYVKKIRLDEIKRNRELATFHNQQNIVTGSELEAFDDDKIPSFQDHPNATILKDLTKDLFEEIKRQIKNKPDNIFVRDKRKIMINVNKHGTPFFTIDSKCLSEKPGCGRFDCCEDKLPPLEIVVNTLIENRILHSLISHTGHGYHLQA